MSSQATKLPRRDVPNLHIKLDDSGLFEGVELTISPEAYVAFLKRLDTPSQPNDRLRRTLTTCAPWDLSC